MAATLGEPHLRKLPLGGFGDCRSQWVLTSHRTRSISRSPAARASCPGRAQCSGNGSARIANGVGRAALAAST